MATVKSGREIEAMRAAGRVVARGLAEVREHAKPGVNLLDLDAVAARVLKEEGANSSFQGYHPRWAPLPFQGVTCLSVNDVVVHGVPYDCVLELGDVLSVDFGAELNGWHGDAAFTMVVGDAAASDVLELVDATRRALEAGIAAAVPGGRMGDIGRAVEEVARAGGFGQLAGHGGHGVGHAMHEEPSVPNQGRPGRGVPLREGMVIAIEPMFHLGGRDGYRSLADGWSLATDDGSLAAHWEHTVAITADGPQILTTP